jgi:hypothetical protein
MRERILRTSRRLRAGVGRARLAHEESGQVLVLFAGFLVVAIGLAALVIDVGGWYSKKRVAQGAADAGALAAAQDLCEDTNAAITVGQQFVAKNITPASASVTTPYKGNQSLVEVAVDTTGESFFAGIFGIDSASIKARAVAGRECLPVEQPLAIFVHELCGAATGNKGLIVNGKNALIQGGIHVNGHLDIGGDNFRSELYTTVYRPPPQGASPPGPAQGAGCKTSFKADSAFCTRCDDGPTNGPEDGRHRTWVTPYFSEAELRRLLAEVKGTPVCDHIHNNDVKYENRSIPDGVHCLPQDKKFTLAGNTSGNITVIGGTIELGGRSMLRPFLDEHPVLFYATKPGGEIIMNPSGDYDWIGYVINRFGGVVSNAQGVTSPFRGLIEAEWININGQDFTMLGTFPDKVPGKFTGGDVILEE